MAKITLTKAEANEIIRKHFGVTSDFEIEITDVQSSKDADDWIDVPSDWEDDFPPPETEQYNKIEILMRCGYTDVGTPEDFDIFWIQENDIYDIIKWRPAK